MSSAVGDQKRNCEHKVLHLNGQLQVHSFYKDGKLEGEYKSWHSNGQLEIQSFYKDGECEGECKLWHSDGQLQVHVFYTNGKREGEYKLWTSQLWFHEFYKDGNIIDWNFTIHKKHIWLRYFNRLRYRANLRRLAVVLDKLLILDLIKICAKY